MTRFDSENGPLTTGVVTLEDEPAVESAVLRRAAEDAALVTTTDGVRAYLRQIGRVALLAASEEIDLAERIEAGLYAAERLRRDGRTGGAEVAQQLHRDLRHLVRDGERAKALMLEANLRLVVSIAKRYTGRGVPFLDLVQEGNIGLIRAVEKFDHTKGYKFSTYATWWIRQAVARAMADQARTIRIPVHMAESINRLGRTQREMRVQLGRDPTVEELGTALDLSPTKVLEVQRYGREPLSLDQTVGDEGDRAFGDLIEDTAAVIAADVVVFTDMQGAIHGALSTLTEREAGIMRLRYGLVDGRPRTLDEIARVHGVTRERIRQIEARTLAKLRHPARARALRDHLP